MSSESMRRPSISKMQARTGGKLWRAVSKYLSEEGRPSAWVWGGRTGEDEGRKGDLLGFR